MKTLPRALVLAGLAVGAAVALLSLPPLPQNPAYHHFADQRTLLGVPHCLNVISNIPFLAVGVLGLSFVLGAWPPTFLSAGTGKLESLPPRPGGPFLTAAERWPYALFFLGVGLTAFGSAYYHLDPDNDRLLWDRLPMAVAFMGLFAAVLAERAGLRLGLGLLGPLVAAGLASVLYWHWTEGQGRGDLRFYYLVQFYPMLALPLLLALFPPRYTGTAGLVAALGWYVLAKLCEHPLDGPIYALGHVVSGHTLKHLAAAVAAYQVLRMLRRRRPVLPAGKGVSLT